MEKKINKPLELIKTIMISLLLIIIIRYFLFTPIIVEGTSMMPTLHNQERVLVNKVNYLIKKPKRFDVIIFHAPGGNDYIKRIIGLPGDHIEYKNDILIINGKEYNEPYLDKYKQELNDGVPLTFPFKLEDTPVNKRKVPNGYLFVLGDNRRFSKDSRTIGVIPMNKVVGITNVIYWPIKDIRIIE